MEMYRQSLEYLMRMRGMNIYRNIKDWDRRLQGPKQGEWAYEKPQRVVLLGITLKYKSIARIPLEFIRLAYRAFP